ncbi:MAG: hypothetical protein U0L09_02270 [Christensenellales bacterium]|nr:hypothetical protein [Christensenellales bacterium]
MENVRERKINAFLEGLAQRYSNAKQEWKADRRNPFKDGRFLAYYEIRETVLKRIEEESFSELFNEIAGKFAAVKREWIADRRNLFKDGRLLAYFEVLKLISDPV